MLMTGLCPFKSSKHGLGRRKLGRTREVGRTRNILGQPVSAGIQTVARANLVSVSGVKNKCLFRCFKPFILSAVIWVSYSFQSALVTFAVNLSTS